MTTDTCYLSKTMAIIIHTHNGTTPYFLQIFSLFQMNNYNNIIAGAPQSQFSLLEEEAMPGYIQKQGDPAQGGGGIPRR